MEKNKTNNYVTSFKIIEEGNYYMELIEAVSCSSFDELVKHERHYIESIDCINKYIPGRTGKEYKIDNKEKIKEQKKQYHSIKIKCPNCRREVIKYRLKRHQLSLKCQSATDILQSNE